MNVACMLNPNNPANLNGVPMAGALTEADKVFVEEWENVSTIQNFIVTLDRRGDEKYVHISGRRNFKITTEERLLTEDKILEDANNPFRNGCFRPVVVPDSVNVQTNPNALSDDEIRSILVSSQLAWDGWMTTITSPETLRRMIDVADEGTADGSFDVSLTRYKQIEMRMRELKPQTRVVQKDQDLYDAMDGAAPPTGGRPGAGVPAAAQAGRVRQSSGRYREAGR